MVLACVGLSPPSSRRPRLRFFPGYYQTTRSFRVLLCRVVGQDRSHVPAVEMLIARIRCGLGERALKSCHPDFSVTAIVLGSGAPNITRSSASIGVSTATALVVMRCAASSTPNVIGGGCFRSEPARRPRAERILYKQ